MEKGGDRCVLTADHLGQHMGGYHTFTDILSAEEMARVIGTHCDALEMALRGKVAVLTAENARLRLDLAEQTSEARSLRERLKDAYADLARVTGERDGLREQLDNREALSESRRAIGEAALKRLGLDPDAAIAACAPPASREE
jgi:hypothetical protein